MPEEFGYDVSKCQSVDDQLRNADLQWTIELSNISYGEDNKYSTKQFKLAYRSDNKKPLAVYGPKRHPFQNRDVITRFNKFCQVNNLKISRLAAINDGRDIIAIASLPWGMDVKNSHDDFRSYMILKESHRNGNGLNIITITERIVCMNMMNSAGVRYNISHASAQNVDKIHDVMQDAINNLKKFKQESEALANSKMDDADALAILIANFGDPELPVNEQPDTIMNIFDLYKGGGLGSDKLSAFNTAYGLLESVKEYICWNHVRDFDPNKRFVDVAFGTRDRQLKKIKNQLVSVYAKS